MHDALTFSKCNTPAAENMSLLSLLAGDPNGQLWPDCYCSRKYCYAQQLLREVLIVNAMGYSGVLLLVAGVCSGVKSS